MNEAELMNNPTGLLTFADAIRTLVDFDIIEREHAKSLVKNYLKKYGFDVPRPPRVEEPKKDAK